MGWCYQSDDSLKAYVRMKLFIIKVYKPNTQLKNCEARWQD